MKLFITGASGYIGAVLARRLLDAGHGLRALVRDPARLDFLAGRPGLEIVRGGLSDAGALEALCEGREAGFHLAGFAKASTRDRGEFDRVNVDGARNLARAARRAGVRRLVHTSSAGVLGPSLDGKPVSEDSPRALPFLNDYERTKAASETAVLAEAAAAGGERALEIVIVNPTRVYGPSPAPELTPYNRLLAAYLGGRWPILPGDGSRLGDYAYVDDVVEGHILALERGRPGRRYLLGGRSLSYAEVFALAAEAAGRAPRLVATPLGVMMAAAGVVALGSALAGRPAPITPAWVRRFSYDWIVDSSRAEAELGYRRTPAPGAMAATVAWLEELGASRPRGRRGA